MRSGSTSGSSTHPWGCWPSPTRTTSPVGALHASGGPEISLDEAWAVHRFQASYTVVATFLAFMPSYMAGEGQGLGVALRTRAELALEDLDVVEALDAALRT